MTNKALNTLSKQERLCGRSAISELLAGAEFIGIDNIKYCCAKNEEGINRIMISVPKKLFKKAVIRNLLKRRMRESYRKQKETLKFDGIDILFVYKSKAILSYEEIYSNVKKVLEHINQKNDKEEK